MSYKSSEIALIPKKIVRLVHVFRNEKILLDSNRELALKIENLEQKYSEQDHQFEIVFDAIKQLLQMDVNAETITKRKIGFSSDS